jgi:hypothetical protein
MQSHSAAADSVHPIEIDDNDSENSVFHAEMESFFNSIFTDQPFQPLRIEAADSQSPTLLETDIAKLNSLEEALKNDTSNWLISLKGLLASDLDFIFDEDTYSREEVKAAFKTIFSGRLEHISDNSLLQSEFTSIQSLLTLQKTSLMCCSLTSRDASQSASLPSKELIRLATLTLLGEKTNEVCFDLTLSPEAKHAIIFKQAYFYIPTKTYLVAELTEYINSLLKPKQLTLEKCYIFADLLLAFAKIHEASAFFNLSEKNRTEPNRGYPITDTSPDFFFMHLGASIGGLQKFLRFYDRLLGDQSIYLAEPKFPGVATTFCLSLPSMIRFVFSNAFKEFVNDFLSNQAVLTNYQLICTQQQTTLNAIHAQLNGVGKHYKIDTCSDFFEYCLLHIFGIKTMPSILMIKPSTRQLDFVTHLFFYTNLSIEETIGFVTAVNRLYPDSAQLVSHHALLETSEQIPLRAIALNKKMLTSDTFLRMLKFALDDINTAHPECIEQWQIASGNRSNTSLDLANELDTLAESNSSPMLKESILQFSFFVKQHLPIKTLQEKKFELEKSIAKFESGIETREQHQLFKAGTKKEIKHIFTKLYLRPVK